MTIIRKCLVASAAALTLVFTLAPAAQAQMTQRGAAMRGSHHGGFPGGGFMGGGNPGRWHGPHPIRHIGWHGHRSWGPVSSGLYADGCFRLTREVWNQELGRHIRVKRLVCN